MQQEDRRLAAIVFTDMVGYSALSQRDEASALMALDEHNLVIRRTLDRHSGREVKTIGDAFLIEFPSALEAVLFSVDAQDELRRVGGRGPGREVSVRIGVHVGDVIHRGGDVFGDAVNIASRLVGAAEAGGVCVSGNVRDQVVNKMSYRLERLPPRPLKNIEQEVDLYRVVLPWEPLPRGHVAPESSANRIAVLPFTNISPDPEDEYFADGLTEELISALSEVRGLRVIARTSVNHYRGSTKGVDEVGRELKVSHLLEGSVRKAGNRIRVTAHLVETRSQEEVWSERYESDLSDVFKIQSGIAANVVASLKVKLLTAERTRMETKETGSIAAYVAYLKGRSLLREGTEKAVLRAKEQFRLAIREDASYARAYAGMADSVMLLGDYLFSPIPVALEEATGYVNKALSLDPNLAEARVSLANLLMYDYRFGDAEGEFRAAIEANPSYATAHHWYSTCLQALGRQEEAVAQLLQAEELDPLSSWIALSAVYRLKGRDDEVEKRIRKLEEIDAGSPLVDEARMVHSFDMKDWKTAEELLKRMAQRDPADPYLDMDFAYLYAVTDRREDAIGLIEKLKEVPESARIRGQLLAFAYVGLGDMDSAFRWLNYAVAHKEDFISWVRAHPVFEPLRADPRFKDLLRSANLPVD